MRLIFANGQEWGFNSFSTFIAALKFYFEAITDEIELGHNTLSLFKDAMKFNIITDVPKISAATDVTGVSRFVAPLHSIDLSLFPLDELQAIALAESLQSVTAKLFRDLREPWRPKHGDGFIKNFSLSGAKLSINAIKSIIRALTITEPPTTELSATEPLTELAIKSVNEQAQLLPNALSTAQSSELSAPLPAKRAYALVGCLDLSLNGIDAAGISEIAEIVPGATFTEWNLSANQLGSTGVVKLARALPKTKLVGLNLAYNDIDCTGAIVLVNALQNTKVRTLGLTANDIGSNCLTASSLANGRQSPMQKFITALSATKVHTLNLSYNMITALGAQQLAETLPATNLTSLDLSGNEIGDDGAAALARVLPDTNIHTLKLSDNTLSAFVVRKLAKTLKIPTCVS